MGKAITSTPQMQQTDPITFPSGVVGQMSPYFLHIKNRGKLMFDLCTLNGETKVQKRI